MKHQFQLLAIVFVSLISAAVNAAQVIITCPTAQQVLINTQGVALGHVMRSDGEHRIYLRGNTASSVATKFTGSSLMADMLSCNYQGNNDDFGIVNYWISGDLYNCRFNNLTYQCLGSTPEACQLICEK